MADTNSTLITVQNEIGGLEVIDTAWDPLTKAWYDRMAAAESRPTFTQTAALDAIVKSLKQYSNGMEAISFDVLDQQFATIQSVEQILLAAQRDSGDPQALPLLVKMLGGASTYARLNQYQHQRYEGYSTLDFTPYVLDIWTRIQMGSENSEVLQTIYTIADGQNWKDLLDTDCIFQFASPDGRWVAWHNPTGYKDNTGLGTSGDRYNVMKFLHSFVLGSPQTQPRLKKRVRGEMNAAAIGQYDEAAAGGGYDLLALLNNHITAAFPPVPVTLKVVNKSAALADVFYNTRRNERTPSPVDADGVRITLLPGEEFSLELNYDAITVLRAAAPEGADPGHLLVEAEMLTLYDMEPYSVQSNF